MEYFQYNFALLVAIYFFKEYFGVFELKEKYKLCITHSVYL